MNFDVIIIGGGAAGLFCAIEAGKRGKKVLLIEHNAEVGRKILISGGGRCNFTNRTVSANNFISQNPHFCKSALARYSPNDFISLVKKHKIEFYEKKLGQLFCKNSAKEIVKMLLDECQNVRVKIQVNCSVTNISKNEKFVVETSNGNFFSQSLVIATGGLSFAKVGATDFGYRIAKKFGHKIVETRPSLVPLVFEKKIGENFRQLAGISLPVAVNTGKQSFNDSLLFTHRGLSGPAVLQISNYWQSDREIEFDLLPSQDFLEILNKNRHRKVNLDNFLSQFFPNRFAEIFTQQNFINKPLNQMSNKEIHQIAEKINDWRVKFDETEGYHKAEVTLGGIDTNELNSATMESKKVAGLYFIGEVVDVTGWLGGYNFQWAWSSGFVCGQSL